MGVLPSKYRRLNDKMRTPVGVPYREWRATASLLRHGLMQALAVAAFASLAMLQPPGYAQTGYPVRPVRIVAPSAAASAADTLARLIAPPLSERIGQQVYVDTRPGAATILGTEAVAKSPPDGHTLLIGLPALAINPSIYKSLPYDGLRD